MTQLAAWHRGSVPRTAGANDQLFVVLATPIGSQRRLDLAALARHGQRVVAVSTMDELRGTLHRASPDVVVVDAAIIADRAASMLAMVHGWRTPLIAVAVRDPAVRVRLLLAGVDDCLAAPYTSEELAARVIAIGRRVYGAETQDSAHVLQLGPVRLDARTRKVHVHGSEVALTAMEFDLLGCFLRHPGQVLSRERLLAEVWGYTSGAAETVTVHVRRLRSKVESDPSRPGMIETIWGIGYRLRVADHLSAVDGSLPSAGERHSALSSAPAPLNSATSSAMLTGPKWLRA
jgi:DNA-binding response OmpR family regulator